MNRDERVGQGGEVVRPLKQCNIRRGISTLAVVAGVAGSEEA